LIALALYWFLYFAALGLFLPFFGLYLSETARLGATEVGTVVTMSPLVALVAPAAWGHVADAARSRVRVLAVATVGAAVSCAALAALDGFWQLAAGAALFALFSTAIIPLTVSITLAALGDDAIDRFGRIRVWGTVGFLVPVVLFPKLARALAPSVGLVVMFPLAAALIIASAAIAPFLPDDKRSATAAHPGRWREVVDRGHRDPFARVLVYLFASFLCLQGPMSLFPVYLRARGSGIETLGHMWILMLLVEIPLVAFSGAGLRRLGSRGLIAGGVAAGGIRWLVCGYFENPWAIEAAQLLHGVTVAGIGIGASLYIEASVPPGFRATAQGLGSMAGAGVGSMLSNVVAGWLIDVAGATAPFRIGGAGAVLLAAAVAFLLPRPSRHDAEDTKIAT
jgi:PPP family 3-phenylpropionic acid transporter